jgi:hypothetical protein
MPPRSAPPRRSRRPRARRPREAGVTLLEVLFGTTVLAVALLTQAGGLLGTHRLQRDLSARSAATVLAQQVLTRIQTDEDWTGLYDRLGARMVEAAGGTGPAFLDGRRGLPLLAYVPDAVIPDGLSDVGVLVQVPPRLEVQGHAQHWPALRENADLPQFGLPADLNADGDIDKASHDDDYVVLPVLVRVRWTTVGGQSGEIGVLSWLRGERE